MDGWMQVSQNKRRYTGEGFDLDLTYVTGVTGVLCCTTVYEPHPPLDRVIAMSFPSSGSAALYRNSIYEVSQFLDQKHPGHYRVYNLCCEQLADPEIATCIYTIISMISLTSTYTS